MSPCHQVDGQPVDPANYEARSGSVVVDLKPAYLETLALGDHTLTAVFDDGNNPTAMVTIVAAQDGEGASDGDGGNGSGNGGSANASNGSAGTSGSTSGATSTASAPVTRPAAATSAASAPAATTARSSTAKTGDAAGDVLAALLLLTVASALTIGVAARRRAED